MTTKPLIAVALLALVPAAIAAPPPSTITVTHAEGGSVKVPLSQTFILNSASSLKRKWSTLHDAAAPLELVGTACPDVVYESGRSGGDYKYKAAYKLMPRESIAALEITFLTFDPFGGHLRTLIAADMTDIEAGTEGALNATWNIVLESEAEQYFACLSYVSRARTATGKVYEISAEAVLAEARKFSKKIGEADLVVGKEGK